MIILHSTAIFIHIYGGRRHGYKHWLAQKSAMEKCTRFSCGSWSDYLSDRLRCSSGSKRTSTNIRYDGVWTWNKRPTIVLVGACDLRSDNSPGIFEAQKQTRSRNVFRRHQHDVRCELRGLTGRRNSPRGYVDPRSRFVNQGESRQQETTIMRMFDAHIPRLACEPL